MEIKEQLELMFKTYFGSAMGDLLRYHYDGRNGWLEVQYREVLDAEGKNFKWTHLCSQNVDAYTYSPLAEIGDERKIVMEYALVRRITLILADTLRSAKQDCNILMAENKK